MLKTEVVLHGLSNGVVKGVSRITTDAISEPARKVWPKLVQDTMLLNV